MSAPAKKSAEVDMSPAAVAARLEEVRALYKLGVSLMTVRVDQARAVVAKAR